MSSSMYLVGRIAVTPELRYGASSGKAWAKFRIADNYKDGEEEKSSFFDVVCWAELAENMAELPIGFRVWFSGYQVMKEWEDKKSGQKRTSYELKASDGGVSMRFQPINIGDKKAAPAQEEKAVEAIQQGFAEAEVPEEEPF
jgi:single-strand DNA-binding protein